MMKRYALFVVLAALISASSAFGQQNPSPAASASARVGGKALSIQYSAPSVRGRQIFGAGGLLSKDPTYPVWRAGANSATTLKTDADLELGGLVVPKGTYTLYVLVRDPNAWELIINKQTGQWGLEYNQRQDLGRVKMQMSQPAAPVEQLKYTLRDLGGNKGELRLEWERHVAVVGFTAR